MKSLKKLMIITLCFILCFTGTTVTANAAAENSADPCYDYTRQASSGLIINSSGKATVSISCTGLNSSVTKITSETCLQRKFGLIWIKANIGTTNNVWTYTANDYLLVTSHSANLSKKGTYRAKTVFTVYKGTSSEKVTIYSLTAEY